MFRLIRTLEGRYWLATGLLLAAALSPLPPGFTPVIVLSLIQILHFLARSGGPAAFPVQVRTGYLLWLLAGLWAPLGFFHWIQLVGTFASVTVDYCPMARLVSLLPWNRRHPLSLHRVIRTFLHPPVRGSILDVV